MQDRTKYLEEKHKELFGIYEYLQKDVTNERVFSKRPFKKFSMYNDSLVKYSDRTDFKNRQ